MGETNYKNIRFFNGKNECEAVEKIGETVVPRCVDGQLLGQVKCSLHGFVDGSVKAYCAVVYFVCESNGAYNVERLAPKTRVASSKNHTISRLELMSGRILAQLMSSISLALANEVEVRETHFWLDSKTVLCCIYNNGEWKKFAHHRANDILKLSRKEDWSHCPGDENPADLGSRGVLASRLKDNVLWWKSPGWLSGPKSGWPVKCKTEVTSESQDEAKKTAVFVTRVEQVQSFENVQDIRRFDSLSKLLRVTGLVIGFVNNLKAKVGSQERKVSILKPRELFAAENALIKVAQASLNETSDYQNLVKQLGVDRKGWSTQVQWQIR